MSVQLPATARLPGEGDIPFAAFAHYLGMGWDTSGDIPRRVPRISSAALNETYGKPNVAMWFRAFEWAERAALYDATVIQFTTEIQKQTAERTAAVSLQFFQETAALMCSELQRSIQDAREKGKVIPVDKLVDSMEKVTRALERLTPRDKPGAGPVRPNLGNVSDAELMDLLQRNAAQ